MLVFKNAYLLDGTGKEPLEGATIVIEGSKITDVGKRLAIPDGAQVIDLSGKPILPGFADAHTHFGGTDRLDRPILTGRFDSYDYAASREAFLNWGVTTVRSGSDFMPDILEFRNEVNENKICSPRIITCGCGLQTKGGHPGYTVYLSNQDILDRALVTVDEDTDIEDQIQKLVDTDVDLIKVFIQDNNPLKNQEVCPRLSNEQLKRIADATHKHGKRLMVHINDTKDLLDAVSIGADTIEHVINCCASHLDIPEKLIETMVERGIWVVPTMFSCRTYDAAIGKKMAYHGLVDAIKRFIKGGVKIGVGCDSGIPLIPYGESLHEEMEILTTLGMSPLEVITAATGGNARLFGQEDTFGTIEPGMVADLVVLGSNPLEDIRNTRNIQMVLRNGKIVVDRFLSE